jgi:hypothetical protein
VRKSVKKVTIAFAGILCAISVNQVVLAPTAAAAVADCPFTDTFCAWDQVDFKGERFTVGVAPPHEGTCVDLVEHGWGERIKSAANTNDRAASLFPNDDCTGRGVAVEGNSEVGSLSFPAKSVYIYA